MKYFVCTLNHFCAALLAAVFVLAIPHVEAAGRSSATTENWDQWQALSPGYTARRKVPPNFNRPVDQRIGVEVERRLDRMVNNYQRTQRQTVRTTRKNRSRFSSDAASNPELIQEPPVRAATISRGRQQDEPLTDPALAQQAAVRTTAANQSQLRNDNMTNRRLAWLRHLERMRQRELMRLRQANRGQPLAAWMRTSMEGLASVPMTELADHLQLDVRLLRYQAERERLAVTRNENPVPWYFDSPSDSLFFAADEYYSFHSSFDAYHFRFFGDSDASPMTLDDGAATTDAGLPTPFTETLRFEEEPDLRFATWAVASEQDADYWFWDHIYGGFKNTIDVTLDIPNPATHGTARIDIRMRGWTDIAPGDEHHVSAELNGQPIGSVSWDGFEEVVLTADVDQTLLDAGGNNALTLRSQHAAGTHPGQFLDDIEVEYLRLPVAENGSLRLHQPAAGTQAVSGFGGDEIVVAEIMGGEGTLRRDVRVEPDGNGGHVVVFDVMPGADYFLAEPGAMHSPLVQMDIASMLKSPANYADYLIIAPRQFTETAEALAALRSARYGAVKIAWLDDIFDEFSAGREDPDAVQRFIEFTRTGWQSPPSAAVLIGKGTLDHKDRMGYGDSFVPIMFTTTPWSLAASDYRLMSLESDDWLVVGRIPIVNDAEGLAYVGKLEAYESVAGSAVPNSAVLVADNPDEAGEFHLNSDLLADKLLNTLGFDDVQKLYHPDDAVRDNLIANETWEARYVSYDGHGSVGQVGDGGEMFIRSLDAEALNNTALPVFTALTCAAGDYSLPGTRSLATALVLNPSGGAIAAMVPTGLSLDADAQHLGNAFVDSLFDGISSIGEAQRDARLQISGTTSDFMQRIYSVTGDPAVYAY